MVIICFEVPALCALLALARPLSISLILYIEREIDCCCWQSLGGGALGVFDLFPLVCLALSPPIKLKSVE
jgi:hypothetical protein